MSDKYLHAHNNASHVLLSNTKSGSLMFMSQKNYTNLHSYLRAVEGVTLIRFLFSMLLINQTLDFALFILE